MYIQKDFDKLNNNLFTAKSDWKISGEIEQYRYPSRPVPISVQFVRCSLALGQLSGL